MIQFNLLPDVKLEYIKSKQMKHSIIMLSIVITGVAVGIFVLLFLTVNVLQKKHINDQTNDIKKYSDQLKQIPDLDKILTVQDQLNALPDLHAKKVVATRLFNYLTQVTPAQASISEFKIDFTQNTMSFTGSADSLVTVNKFVDSLKFTDYTVANATESKKAFSDVVLSSFSRSDTSTSYLIDLKYDPVIFDSANEVTLKVPNIISTRSETEKPEALFQEK
jgi:Tfp pilus assembly protein PilN